MYLLLYIFGYFIMVILLVVVKPWLLWWNRKNPNNHNKQPANKQPAKAKNKASKANKANKKATKKNKHLLVKSESKTSLYDNRKELNKDNEPSTSNANNNSLNSNHSNCNASNSNSTKVGAVNSKTTAMPTSTATATATATSTATPIQTTTTAAVQATLVTMTPATATGTGCKRTENPINGLTTANAVTVKKAKNATKKGPTWLKFSNTAISVGEKAIQGQSATIENTSICRPGTLYSDVLFGAGTSCVVKVKNLVPRRTSTNTNTAINQKKFTKALYKRSGTYNDTSEDSEGDNDNDLFPRLQEGSVKSNASSTPRSETIWTPITNRNSTLANYKINLNTTSPRRSVNCDQIDMMLLNDSTNYSNKTIDTSSSYGTYLEEHFPQLGSTVGGGGGSGGGSGSGNRSSVSHSHKSTNSSIISNSSNSNNHNNTNNNSNNSNNSASTDCSFASSTGGHSETSNKMDAFTFASSSETTDSDTKDIGDNQIVDGAVGGGLQTGDNRSRTIQNGLKTNCSRSKLKASQTNYSKNTIRSQYSVQKRFSVDISAWNYLEIDVSTNAFPKFLCQFSDEHYLKFERMALLGLKLALGNSTQQGKFKF